MIPNASKPRRAIVIAALTFTTLYGAGAVFFYRQEYRARNPVYEPGVAVEKLYHPEAVLGVLRDRADGVYPDELLASVHRSLELAPSFYQGPLFLAHYHAQRHEEPARALQSFEVAVRRFPVNGRIRLAYAEWLLEARSDLTAWKAFTQHTGGGDPLELAEEHLREALALEPRLAPRALASLARSHVPPNRWRSVLPDDVIAERALILALHDAGHHAESLEGLRRLASSTSDATDLAHAARWALEWGSPALALNTAARLPAGAPAGTLVQAALVAARAHWALGEPDSAYDRFQATLLELEARLGSGSSDTLAFLCTIGDEYLRRDEVLLAKTFYTEATARQRMFVPAALGLARAYRRQNDARAAIEQYEKVLHIEAEHDQAQRELAALLASP